MDSIVVFDPEWNQPTALHLTVDVINNLISQPFVLPRDLFNIIIRVESRLRIKGKCLKQKRTSKGLTVKGDLFD